MLAMLTKELLYDMGIKAVGDVLAILAYAKQTTFTESDTEKVCYLKCNLCFFKFCFVSLVCINLHLILR